MQRDGVPDALSLTLAVIRERAIRSISLDRRRAASVLSRLSGSREGAVLHRRESLSTGKIMYRSLLAQPFGEPHADIPGTFCSNCIAYAGS